MFVLAGVWLCGCGLQVESRGQDGRRRRVCRERRRRGWYFRALCKTSNRSRLARGVDGRVVGPLSQVASHIVSHMVYISPHCLRPSSNWQVMYRPSLLFFSFINGRHSDGGGGDSGSGLGTVPHRGPALTLYTVAGFTKVFISRASPLPLRVFFLLPSAVKGKSKL